MSNQNYAHVNDLLAAGQLNWVSDSILALLVSDAAFDVADTRLSDVGARLRSSAPIQGRWLGEGGMAMGLPATFNQVAADQEYQVIVAKDDGGGNPLVLSFINEDTEGTPISVQRGGSLIVRPTQENLPVPPETMEPPPTTGFWMKL